MENYLAEDFPPSQLLCSVLAPGDIRHLFSSRKLLTNIFNISVYYANNNTHLLRRMFLN